jgi:hypothetical protein
LSAFLPELALLLRKKTAPYRQSGQPLGGLADIALKSTENSLRAWRTVKLLQDEEANPPVFPEEKREEFRTNFRYSLSRQAFIDLVYESRSRAFSMRIDRCQSEIEADRQWSRNRRPATL